MNATTTEEALDIVHEAIAEMEEAATALEIANDMAAKLDSADDVMERAEAADNSDNVVDEAYEKYALDALRDNGVGTIDITFGSEKLTDPGKWLAYVGIMIHLTGSGERFGFPLDTRGQIATSPAAATLKGRALALAYSRQLSEMFADDEYKIIVHVKGLGYSLENGRSEADTAVLPTPEKAAPASGTSAPASAETAATGTATPETAEPETTAPEFFPVYGQDEAKMIIEAALRVKPIPHNVMLEGHTGTGKTTLLHELAARHGKKLIRVSLNGQTSKEDFVGQFLVKSGETGSETYWIDGVLIQAMKQGDWIVCDEINAALPEILFVLQSVLDDDRSVRLVEKDGEVIHAHPDFRFFGAMNPSDEYAGTKELNTSLRSRFKSWIHFDYPPADIERRILIERTGCQPGDALIMVELATRLRRAKTSGHCYTPVSTRDLLAWAELAVELKDRALAMKYGFMNRVGVTGTEAKFFRDEAAKVDSEWAAFVKTNGGVANTISLMEELKTNMAKAATMEADAKKLVEGATRQAAKILSEAEEARLRADAELRARELKVAEQEKKIKDSMMDRIATMLAEEMAKVGVGTAPVATPETNGTAAH